MKIGNRTNSALEVMLSKKLLSQVITACETLGTIFFFFFFFFCLSFGLLEGGGVGYLVFGYSGVFGYFGVFFSFPPGFLDFWFLGLTFFSLFSLILFIYLLFLQRFARACP
jgi:hypothetical protein